MPRSVYPSTKGRRPPFVHVQHRCAWVRTMAFTQRRRPLRTVGNEEGRKKLPKHAPPPDGGGNKYERTKQAQFGNVGVQSKNKGTKSGFVAEGWAVLPHNGGAYMTTWKGITHARRLPA